MPENNYIRPVDNTVVILGLPATGKTTLAAQILDENPGIKLIATDDFIEEPDNEFLYDRVINEKESRVVIEGISGFDLLLLGVQRFWCPDLIIFCTAKSSTREQRYAERGKNFFGGRQFDNNLMIKWWSFKNSGNAKRARIIEHLT